MGLGQSHFTKFSREHNYTVLLLGQTGSGKTSLLNLIANMNMINEVHFDSESILSAERLKEFGTGRVTDLSVENAVNDPMASKTSDARVYQLQLCRNWFMTMIDTPGFGDSRGIAVDKQHIKRIMACLGEKVQTINCVMIVVQGRDSRMTPSLKYALAQLASVMPQSVMDHIVLVFTNTESKRKLNFDVKCFKDLGIEIPKSECIDNAFCTIRNSLGHIPAEHLQTFDEEDLEAMTKELRQCTKAVERLGWKIHDLSPVPSRKSLSCTEKALMRE